MSAFDAYLKSSLISHNSIGDEYIGNILNRLQQADTLVLPLSETMEIFEEMQTFELGRFLLQNRGLNGYWTSYIISEAPMKELSSPLEAWIINRAPVVLATRERFHIFQKHLQDNLRSNIKIASVPCGVMNDLLSLDFEGFGNITLLGIDLDESALVEAKSRADKLNLKETVDFMQKDAWDLGFNEEIDILTSNGLNIYEASDAKVIGLYKEFYKALRPGGMLITSFLTPPPALSADSPWKDVNLVDAAKQRAIFGDIIQAQWQVFRTADTTREQLLLAGFINIEFIYDKSAMFPTVLAYK